MLKPIILDVFTSAKNSKRKKTVFRVGQSIQWNIVHTNLRTFQRLLHPDLPSIVGQPIRIRYFVQHYGLISIISTLTIDVVFRHHEFWKIDTGYHAPFQKDWVWIDSIPHVDIPVLEGGNVGFGDLPDSRERMFREISQLWDSEPDSVFLPSGFWKFQAFVEMTGPDTDRLFGVSKEVHFRILDTGE